MRRREVLMWGLAGLVGCADDTDASVEAATQRRATPATLGGSYALRLSPRDGALADDNAGVFALSLEAGEQAAVVMRRRDDSALRAFIAAYGPDGTRLTDRQHGQRELIMAGPDDGLLVLSAAQGGRHLIVATDEEMAVLAETQIDIIALASAPSFPLPTYDPAADAWLDELRRIDAELAPFFDDGSLWEAGDGHLGVDLSEVALKDRARLNRLLPAGREARDALFSALAEEPSGKRFEEAAAFCGALWAALRSDVHRLRPV